MNASDSWDEGLGQVSDEEEEVNLEEILNMNRLEGPSYVRVETSNLGGILA